ncbi:hypothetical protein C3L33_18473, partial [Rhododendron williamsianum]
MEKLLKPYDREYMKMAMLKHEETFKHQVYELHRLYRIQKILMKSMKTEGRTEYIAECDENGELEVEDESEIKLTLGTSSYGRRKKVRRPPEVRFPEQAFLLLVQQGKKNY